MAALSQNCNEGASEHKSLNLDSHSEEALHVSPRLTLCYTGKVASEHERVHAVPSQVRTAETGPPLPEMRALRV